MKVVVVGNGMVGHHYVQRLVDSQVDANITIIGEEPRPAYDRVHLSSIFDDKTPSDLALSSAQDYRDLGVATYFGDPVDNIDRAAKQVTTRSGLICDYDKLVLATGSSPFIPSIDGNDLPHCHPYRTIDDLAAISTSAKDAQTGVVIGGGLLGLEAANALKNLGLEVHIIEIGKSLMNTQLDESAGNILKQRIESLGIKVHTASLASRITAGTTHRLSIDFNYEKTLETDLVVFSAGIRPNDQLAVKSGLKLGPKGGFLIDNQCKTSDENIFAIGECAAQGSFIYGLVTPGYKMAEAAVSQLSDDKKSFSGTDLSTKLKLLGVDVGSIGNAKGATKFSRSCVFSDERNGIYKRINTSINGKLLLGAILVGDVSDYDMLLQYYRSGIELPDQPERLVLPPLDANSSFLTVDKLADEARICSCNNVSKIEITQAVQAGSNTLQAIKESTKASTGCGSCTGLVERLVEQYSAS